MPLSITPRRASDPKVLAAARQFSEIIASPHPTTNQRIRLTQILVEHNVPEQDLLEIAETEAAGRPLQFA